MRSRPDLDSDPLAVWTHVEGGEEIAYGHPSVTDQERAAAGRETIAERSRSLLADNQRRAAERYAAAAAAGAATADADEPDADEPDADEVTRVWYPREAGALRSRLRDAPLAVWAEDDILHVLWKGEADEVQLGSGVQPLMWPVPGSDDLWEASLRIRRLAEAVISITVFPSRAREPRIGRPSVDHVVWRGPRAPALRPAAESLAGMIEDHTIDSTALGVPRSLTVYRPPGSGQAGPLPACIVADARTAGIRHYLAAGTLEPGFRQSTRQWAERLQRAGLTCRHHEWVGGHDNFWWEQEFPVALGWLLAPD